MRLKLVLVLMYLSNTMGVVMNDVEVTSLAFRKDFWSRAALGDQVDFLSPVEFIDPFELQQFSKFVHENHKILDFGCGYGRIVNILNQAGFKNVLGVDIAPGMIARAKQQFPKKTRHFYLYDGCTLPFDDHAFDAITSFTVLNAIPNHELGTVFDEIKRVLKPGGIFYLYEFMIAPFPRDIKRYDEFKQQNPEASYGTFRHASGAIMKHFARQEINDLLVQFK